MGPWPNARTRGRPGGRGVHLWILFLAAAAGLSGLALFESGKAASTAEEPASRVPLGRISSTSSIRYGRDIRPLLSDRCFRCHGPDAGTRAADLRLDLAESAFAPREGGPAITPGDPQASQLWHRVTSRNPAVRMPPPDSHKRPLSEEELDRVRRWILEGADYEPHWAFVPPVRPAVPEVRNPGWCRNPIDRFILARLEEEGVEPSPEADQTTLVRRLFLDLTGLPPTPEEIDAFLADPRPDAWERWIDRLLHEEPYRSRYAERMTVPWLDQARYADTCGIHMDAGRQMWLWRDWVIEAYRQHMPFDRFLTEQLAGDLLPEATEAQLIASGFHRNHVTTDEGGAIPEEYLVEYAVDRTDTTGAVFLGLTIGCARCHEHKYDPISQDDYYRLLAFFNSIEEPGLYSQLPDPNRAFEPFIVVPTPEQKARLAGLREKVAALGAELETTTPQELADREAFFAGVARRAGIAPSPSRVMAATSFGGATLTVQDDGSVLVSGENPDKDEHQFILQTETQNLRLLMLEALPDPSLPHGRVGRAANGNAVLSGIEAEAVSVRDPSRSTSVRFIWAWADYEQDNGDFRIVNLLGAEHPERGWAVGGHLREDGRLALLLTEQPIGFEGGTELRLKLHYRSIYAQHVLGRVRFSVAAVSEPTLDMLPAAVSSWYLVGPLPAESRESAYQTAFGPEESATLDFARNFGFGNQFWRFDPGLRDEQVNPLPEGTNLVMYVGRRIFAPGPRSLEVSLGSDDGFTLFANGRPIAAREVNRGVAPDQDSATVPLVPGENSVVLKVVNVGGPGGFYYRALAREGELVGELVAALLPESLRTPELTTRMHQAWKLAFSTAYRERRATLRDLEQQIAALEAQAPRTMVMKELPSPRETYVLIRGVYDRPDRNRPVTRGVPAALGRLPEEFPQNRLGLARWLTAADNPLVARVTVNRYWEMIFGTGLVRTSEDFGLQGEWPSHPELLDWLAVEFRESGWRTDHMLRLILSSATYRQSSRIRPEIRERDPDNRWLAWFPRRRLTAEFIRDQALYVAGLLVERLGGPSVKPYQPEGLWQEVSMIQSNTRIYQRGEGEDLYRRSLYTYWKRACPPPSMQTFDAPTRESCTVRRTPTNTPLQALVLWNDEQFVEAARILARRTLAESGDDRQRLAGMYRRCTGRMPEEPEQAALVETLEAFRERYRQAPEDAARLLTVGATPAGEDIDPAELAAWTLVANALLNLSAVVTQQ